MPEMGRIVKRVGMEKTFISVIMSNFNTPIEYLRESVESILRQTYDCFEFIIVDDASTDQSVEYLRNLKDSRIRLIFNKRNLGLTKSLNIAMRSARGQYIARMDSDDISLPERFQKQIEFMENNKDVIVCGTWFEKFGAENCVRRPIIDNFQSYRCQLIFSNTPITVCHPSVMMRKSMLDQYCIEYDESLLKAQDYGMWVECSKYGRIAILEEILIRYRIHDKQISATQNEQQKKCSEKVFRKQMEDLGIDNLPNRPSDEMGNFKYYCELFERIIESNKIRDIYNQESLISFLEHTLRNQIRRMQRKNVLKLIVLKDKYAVEAVKSICLAKIKGD